VELVLAVCVGVALAACSGLRAFVPLLASGLLARSGHYELGEHLQWLSSTPALVALSIAALVEFVADKVPALDHALDVAQTPVRTVAGMLVAMAACSHAFPMWAAVLLGIVAGGGTALGVHATKATVRAGSTVTTAGLANPVISTLEDVGCAVVSFLAPVLAAVALLASLVALAAVFFGVRAVVRKLRKKPAENAPAQAPS
jgi:hypothetical protein